MGKCPKGLKMAKVGIKNERIAVELLVAVGAVVIKHEKRNGETFEVASKAQYSFKELPSAIQDQVALYGLNKLLQDRTSQLREHGIAATLEGIESVYATLQAGEWSAKRKAKTGASDDSVLIAVIAESMGKPVSVVAVMFAKLDQAGKKALAAKFADQVAAAKAAADDDADDFFSDL